MSLTINHFIFMQFPDEVFRQICFHSPWAPISAGEWNHSTSALMHATKTGSRNYIAVFYIAFRLNPMQQINTSQSDKSTWLIMIAKKQTSFSDAHLAYKSIEETVMASLQQTQAHNRHGSEQITHEYTNAVWYALRQSTISLPAVWNSVFMQYIMNNSYVFYDVIWREFWNVSTSISKSMDQKYCLSKKIYKDINFQVVDVLSLFITFWCI